MNVEEYIKGIEKYRSEMSNPPQILKEDVFYVTHNVFFSGKELGYIIDEFKNEQKVKVKIHDENGERETMGYIDDDMCYLIDEIE